jgi:hypothetical protein
VGLKQSHEASTQGLMEANNEIQTRLLFKSPHPTHLGCVLNQSTTKATYSKLGTITYLKAHCLHRWFGCQQKSVIQIVKELKSAKMKLHKKWLLFKPMKTNVKW